MTHGSADSGVASSPDSEERMGRRHLRGSSLLFVGRMATLGFTVATQVIIVRALSKGEFGAFAFAFAITTASRTVLSLGQGRTLSRFLAIYDEARDHARLLGSVLIAVGSIVFTSLLLIGGLFAWQDRLAGSVVDDKSAVTVLLVLAFLAPMEALDQVFVSLFAVFTKARSIFFRKYVLTPGLRFVVVLVVALVGGDALDLAVGYVIASVAGLAFYTTMLTKVFRERQLLEGIRLRDINWPFRSVLSFSIPLLSTELVFLSMNLGSVMLLSAYHGPTAVAEYRAVFPAARMNQVVFQTFITLFLPLAARLFARREPDALRDAYWRTAAFLACLSFPAFAMTGPLAPATTVALFGHRYADSAPILGLLALGYYVNGALGFNATTLQVQGRIRFLLAVNLFSAGLNIALSLALVTSYGALGMAIANCVTLLAQNALNQYGLRRSLKTAVIDRRYWGTYGSVTVVSAVLLGAQLLLSPGIAVSLALATLGSVVVLAYNRRVLQLASTFPELRRLPLLGQLLASDKK